LLRRFIRFNSGPLVLLSIVSTFALGTFIIRRIIGNKQKADRFAEIMFEEAGLDPSAAADEETGGSTPAASAPADSEEAGTPPEQQPSSGTVFVSPSSGCIAPLTVEVSGPDNYYIYLKFVASPEEPSSAAPAEDTASDSLDVGFYAAADSSVSLDVPAGVYRLTYAVGETWLGLRKKFGPDTRYYRAEAPLTFSVDGYRLLGNTVRLYPPIDGASAYHRIDASEFPG
jgi:hypothetical protein